MLSVGREINIAAQCLICGECPWEGGGPELKTGLVRINLSDIYLYSYRCPECESYEVASKGKLLAFAMRFGSAGSRRNADEEVHSRDTVEKTNRSWK